jgi:hypothetical protein
LLQRILGELGLWDFLVQVLLQGISLGIACYPIIKMTMQMIARAVSMIQQVAWELGLDAPINKARPEAGIQVE